MMLACLLGLAVAHAQPATDSPLAIPASPPATLTAEKLGALRTYKAQRLQLRDEVEVVGGGYSVIGGWGYPYGRWGWGQTTMVVPEPTQVRRHWAIYRGPERVDTLRFLDLVDQPALRDHVSDDLRRYKRRSAGWFTLGGAGLAGIVGGMVWLNVAPTYEQAVWANRTILIGTAAGGLGLLFGSFPRAKAERLQRYPAVTVSYEEARQMADAHNDALRDTLGLTPAEVWSLESADGSR